MKSVILYELDNGDILYSEDNQNKVKRLHTRLVPDEVYQEIIKNNKDVISEILSYNY